MELLEQIPGRRRLCIQQHSWVNRIDEDARAPSWRLPRFSVTKAGHLSAQLEVHGTRLASQALRLPGHRSRPFQNPDVPVEGAAMLVCLADRAMFQLQVRQATTSRPCMAATGFSGMQRLRCLEVTKALSFCRSLHDHLHQSPGCGWRQRKVISTEATSSMSDLQTTDKIAAVTSQRSHAGAYPLLQQATAG